MRSLIEKRADGYNELLEASEDLSTEARSELEYLTILATWMEEYFFEKTVAVRGTVEESWGLGDEL